jgi:hypothetical protein
VVTHVSTNLSELAWLILVDLAAPTIKPQARIMLETRIIEGESLSSKEIKSLRGRLKPGSPLRQHRQAA